MIRALVVVALLLAAAPAAHAHGGAGKGFASRVDAVVPAVEGVSVVVLGGDDRLRLTNRSGRTILIRGYAGEPYLRFDADRGVYENRRSPAVYENRERYGVADLPAEADAEATPRWERVSAGRAYEWHDHRVHWMSPIPPPQVKAEPDRRHRVFDWRVPGEANGRRLAIRGSLTYAPPPGGRANWTLIAASALVGTAAVGTMAVRWLQRRRA